MIVFASFDVESRSTRPRACAQPLILDCINRFNDWHIEQTCTQVHWRNCTLTNWVFVPVQRHAGNCCTTVQCCYKRSWSTMSLFSLYVALRAWLVTWLTLVQPVAPCLLPVRPPTRLDQISNDLECVRPINMPSLTTCCTSTPLCAKLSVHLRKRRRHCAHPIYKTGRSRWKQRLNKLKPEV